MEQKKFLSYADTKKILKPTILENGKCLTVNECSAAEKIKDYPEDIQQTCVESTALKVRDKFFEIHVLEDI